MKGGVWVGSQEWHQGRGVASGQESRDRVAEVGSRGMEREI